MSHAVAIQLYTVRDTLKQDPAACLAALADIGYEHVELAGTAGLSTTDFADLMARNKLKACGGHTNLQTLETLPPSLVEDARTLGYDQIVLSYLADDQRTPEGYRHAARVMTQAAAALADQGLGVVYHNHAFEFDKLADGSIGYDILTDACGEQVGFELDLYWVAKGGHDALAWMDRLGSRQRLTHVKDMAQGPDKGFAEVGTGVLDLRTMVHAALKAGSRCLIVEQDSNWKVDPLTSARVSFENLKAMLA